MLRIVSPGLCGLYADMSRLHPRAAPAALTVMAVFCCWPSALLAQSMPTPLASPSMPGTLSLTDEQKMAVLNSNTEDGVDAARAGPGGTRNAGRSVHGEIGTVIGSHGTRGVYGAAAIPLGDNAEAVVSFERSRFGYRP